jgi:hypothetical protein
MRQLGTCTYCLLTGNAMNLTRLHEKGKPQLKLQYCPHCLPGVKKFVDEQNEMISNYGQLPIYWLGEKGKDIILEK